MDSTIHLNETVEKKGIALFQQRGVKTHKQHALQYYIKQHRTFMNTDSNSHLKRKSYMEGISKLS